MSRESKADRRIRKWDETFNNFHHSGRETAKFAATLVKGVAALAGTVAAIGLVGWGMQNLEAGGERDSNEVDSPPRAETPVRPETPAPSQDDSQQQKQSSGSTDSEKPEGGKPRVEGSLSEGIRDRIEQTGINLPNGTEEWFAWGDPEIVKDSHQINADRYARVFGVSQDIANFAIACGDASLPENGSRINVVLGADGEGVWQSRILEEDRLTVAASNCTALLQRAVEISPGEQGLHRLYWD